MASSAVANVGSSSSNETKVEFLPGYSDVTDFSKQVFSSVMSAVKTSNELPAYGDDFDYYSSFQGFRNIMDIEGKRVLQLMQSIMKQQTLKGSLAVNEHTDLDDKFDTLVDANDQLLERVGLMLDEAAGLKKHDTPLVIASMTPQTTPTNASWNKKKRKSALRKGSGLRLLAARYVQRPQTKFKDKIDNTKKPFVPLIKHKPNAMKSLEESLLIKNIRDLDCDNGDVRIGKSFPHPYQHELDHFSPTADQLEKTDPKMPGPVDIHNCQLIHTQDGLRTLCETLSAEKEIAVDLEHHSYRSYLGLTCLMQISSRSCDWLVDTLALRSEMHLLNDIFTNPNIVKVFHGADSDVDWLQRDLGLYVVNMFDTGQAARTLNFARFSLAFLLLHFCDIEADKQYQLADWRIRPLPDELIHYAIEDTHYLLYIYDSMKNLLLEKGNENNNLLLAVLHKSKLICQKVFEKPNDVDGIQKLCRKSRKFLNSQQMAALLSIYEWRDKIAREDDESAGYILPNHMLLHIAEVLPREAQGVLACCNPIPPLLRQYVADIHKMVVDAREIVVKNVELPRKMQPSKLQHPRYDVNSLLHCPHDSSHFKFESETDDKFRQKLDSSLVKPVSQMFNTNGKTDFSRATSIFNTLSRGGSTKLTAAQKKVDEIMKSLVSPLDKVQKPQTANDWIKKSPVKAKPTEVNSWLSRTSSITNVWGDYVKAAAVKNPPIAVQIITTDELKSKGKKKSAKLSLREQTKSQTKKLSHGANKTNTNTASTSTEEGSESKIPKMKRAKILDEVEAKLKEFKAFDYSQTDMKIFQKDESKKKGKIGGKGKSKGPGRKRNGPGGAGKKKSLTYTKMSSSGNKAPQWRKI